METATRFLGRSRGQRKRALRPNLLSLQTTRTRHVGNDPNVAAYDPDLWTDDFAFLSQPGQGDIQSDLFYNYQTNVDAYPKWQAWMREKQPRPLVIWGKYEQFVYHRGGSNKPSVVTATWEGYKKAGPLIISTDHHGTADGQRLQVSSFLTHQLS
jgi:hypothetical protein